MSSYHQGTELPQPSADQTQHSIRLIEAILNHMEQAGGVISFQEYMQHCLYAPGLGYYTAGATKFGEAGDFVTAPELTPLFGQVLGNYAAACFKDGTNRHILEFGAGSGKMCVDIIDRLGQLNQHWDAYFILEPSPDLQQRQQQYLASHLSPTMMQRIHWLQALPDAYEGLVLGNEVLDAMPVNVVLKEGGWIELGVGFDGKKFVWREFSRDSESVRAIQKIDTQSQLPEQYCTEVNLNYLPWCQALARHCQQVRVLLIDYGYSQAQYYHSARATGTLICFYQHRSHPDPFIYPGLQDITAFVDFDAFAEAAIASGFKLDQLSSQADFLMRYGLLELAEGIGDEIEMLQLAQQIKTLTLPGEMGDKFKVVEMSLEGNNQVKGK